MNILKKIITTNYFSSYDIFYYIVESKYYIVELKILITWLYLSKINERFTKYNTFSNYSFCCCCENEKNSLNEKELTKIS